MDGDRYIARINDLKMLEEEQRISEEKERKRIKDIKSSDKGVIVK